MPPGAPAQLVVNAPCLVPFGTDDVQAAFLEHLAAIPFGLALGLRHRLIPLLRCSRRDVEPLLGEQFACQPLRVAAEQDVHATTRHVGGNRDRAGTTRLGDDDGFFLV